MRGRLIFSTLVLLVLCQSNKAKEWRGIVPLKSTRADVERLIGKPNQSGDNWADYQLKQERVSFRYDGGPCTDLYQTLGKDNCKCMLAENTVMSITVEPFSQRKFSELNLDMHGFTKASIAPYPDNFAYYNSVEGIYYEVDQAEDRIRSIEYGPSSADCRDIISRNAPAYRNSWRGLIPLHATRSEVERLLGPPETTWENKARYGTDHEVVTATYAAGNCSSTGAQWSVSAGTLIELVIGQRYPFLLSRLNLDLGRYRSRQEFPVRDVANPPKIMNYFDRVSGINIRAQSTSYASEEVINITYLPAERDRGLRCPKQ